MITFFALLEVTAGKEGEFEALQRELSELTHQHEPDTLIYDVIKHQENRESTQSTHALKIRPHSSITRKPSSTIGLCRPSSRASKMAPIA